MTQIFDFNLGSPLELSYESFGVLCYFFLTVPFTFVCIGLLAVLILTFQWWLLIAYAIWLWHDWKSPKKGGYQSEWVRSWRVHKWFADYFPVRLHKAAELQPYQAPIHRELLLLMGCVDCSKESLEYILSHPDKGKAAVLIVGGAEEGLDAHPGSRILTLNARRGFIRLALTTGASLVPAYSFGENEIFDQMDNPRGSKLRKFQTILKKLTGIHWVIFHGRGIFQSVFGPLPYRRPIDTVLGAPLKVTRNENPTDGDIDDLQRRYIEAIADLFETHKTKFGEANDAKLTIV